MERYIGLDVHAASCTLAVVSEKARRRLVKDLAALHFSASRLAPISRTDALRFFQRYLGVPALSASHRRLARAVLRESARIEHHNRGRET